MMKKAAHLVGLSLLSFVAVFVASSSSAYAAQVTNAKDTLSDSRPNPITSTHTFNFTHPTGGSSLQEVQFFYCTQPSGTCTVPTNLVTTATTKGTVVGLTNANWTLLNTTNGQVRFQDTAGGENPGASAVMTFPVQSVTNHTIGDCNAAGNSSTDTCYVRITSCTNRSSCSSTKVDEGIISYTVVAAVTVTARVDPTFTFVVNSVGSSTVNNSITTSVASTFSTLPFSNLTAGTPKYAAHKLNVTTNTQGGYTVSAKMSTQMTGVYTANNIDPFAPTVGGFAWSSPAAWTEPTGSTPNDNTGWIGANTTDTDVTGWNSSPGGKFGPISSTANTVMQSSSSDNGATAIYVTYAIEANTFQPADTYTGTLIYNALPTY